MNVYCNKVILYTLEMVLSQSNVVSRVIVKNQVHYKRFDRIAIYLSDEPYTLEVEMKTV